MIFQLYIDFETLNLTNVMLSKSNVTSKQNLGLCDLVSFPFS